MAIFNVTQAHPSLRAKQVRITRRVVPGRRRTGSGKTVAKERVPTAAGCTLANSRATSDSPAQSRIESMRPSSAETFLVKVIIVSLWVSVCLFGLNIAHSDPFWGLMSAERSLKYYLRNMIYNAHCSESGHTSHLAAEIAFENIACDSHGLCSVQARVPSALLSGPSAGDSARSLGSISAPPLNGRTKTLDLEFQMHRNGFGGFSRGNVPLRFRDLVSRIRDVAASG